MTSRTGTPSDSPSDSSSDSSLATRLGRELEGEVLFDSFSRGLYSTDASIYQVEPVGVGRLREEENIPCVNERALCCG